MDNYDTKLTSYLDAPITVEEFACLHLPARSMQRLQYLLMERQHRSLTHIECAQLQAFQQAAFYMRMGNSQKP